ncbi:DUF6968 family protein [Methylobacterium goesingense]
MVQIKITIFAPETDDISWICRYRIDWPSGIRSSFGVGFDAVQVLHLTLQ